MSQIEIEKQSITDKKTELSRRILGYCPNHEDDYHESFQQVIDEIVNMDKRIIEMSKTIADLHDIIDDLKERIKELEDRNDSDDLYEEEQAEWS